jgi:transcriptional regulator with XRE-family HTH domain
MNIGENIKKYRKEKKITQKQLADKINISEMSIRRYERGERQPTADIIDLISKALDIPIYSLVDDVHSDLDYEMLKYYSDEKKFSATEYSDIMNKRPSDIETEKQLLKEAESINHDFDNFASNKYVQKDFEYIYSDLSLFEQGELCDFIREMLRLKVLDIKSRKK